MREKMREKEKERMKECWDRKNYISSHMEIIVFRFGKE